MAGGVNMVAYNRDSNFVKSESRVKTKKHMVKSVGIKISWNKKITITQEEEIKKSYSF